MRVSGNTSIVLLTAIILLLSSPTLALFEPTTPEAAGVPTEAIVQAKALCEEAGSAALLVLHDGKTLLSWGEVDREYWIHSIRKSMLNSLLGRAVEAGEIDLDATLAELGLDDIEPALTDDEKLATVRQLLKSRSGIYHEAAGEAASMISTRPSRGSHSPGEEFYYNNWDFNALGVIYEKKTGRKIFEAFAEEIARPLGMEHFDAEDGLYHFEKEKSDHPAYHMRMSARDMARYGQLYLQGGMWEGEQIVPAAWIAESVRSYSVLSEEWGIHYGQLWYVIPEDDPAGGPWFFHTGAGVHMLAVIPGRDLVIVHRVDTDKEPITFNQQYLYALMDIILGPPVPQ